MKAQILNGARGVEKQVHWKDSKHAPIAIRTVRNVDFCLGENVADKDGVLQFEQRGAVQRIQVPVGTTAIAIAAKVKARARELMSMVAVVPEPTTIDLGGV